MASLFEALDSYELDRFAASLTKMGRGDLRLVVERALQRLRFQIEDDACEEMASNFRLRETRVSIELWAQLFDALVSSNGDDLVEIVRTWGQHNILKSEPCFAEPILGRVVTEDDFVAVVSEEAVIAPLFVRRAIRLLKSSSGSEWKHGVQYLYGRVNQLPAGPWRAVPIGRYLMWGTFGDSSRVSPFVTFSKTDLLESLGMEERTRTTWIAFAYKLPDGIVARYPTVVEAAASAPWNAYFRPAPSGEHSGLTYPGDKSALQGRPEVVHHVVELDTLCSPIAELVY